LKKTFKNTIKKDLKMEIKNIYISNDNHKYTIFSDKELSRKDILEKLNEYRKIRKDEKGLPEIIDYKKI